ncbi:MAG: 2-nitropropane dioxygenase [Phototrophicales bacterium]|nr:MAG: 2-nitropropane dioxygenase [Phototrophicales bacterium]
MELPKIIQGGMGVAISDWRLANTVAREGHLGVVSGTGIVIVLVARLMKGDPGGHVRRALAHFPDQEIAQEIIKTYYVEGGIPDDQPFKSVTMWSLNPPKKLNQITVVANFVEVWLAKEGHQNPVGINLLEKVQLPNLASLYGAMLADVDFVIMGAGVPMQIPGALDKFVHHQAADYRVDVIGATQEDDYRIKFDPQEVFPGLAEKVGPLKRPMFLPIISSFVLAQALVKRANGRIDGFVIETPIAGGHNAPPRGKYEVNEHGEPIYTEKDEVDLEKIKKLGLPFWLAGGYGDPNMFRQALELGAAGIQVGTAFAYCNESGMEPSLKQRIIDKVLAGEIVVRTNALASPTGFPFKTVMLEGTVADPAVYAARQRICDYGFLRHLVKGENGKVIYRCPAEPVDHYVKKGGREEDTVGRTCLCNNLGATAGFGQRRKGYVEPPSVTSGNDLVNIAKFIKPGQRSYSAKDVIEYLMQGIRVDTTAIPEPN